MTGSNAIRRIERTLLVDADDTLWENNIYYLRCTAEFLNLMESLGFGRSVAQTLLDTCEQETIRELGYGPQGYIKALGLAAERLHLQAGRSVAAELVAQASALGEPVISPPIALLANIEATLIALQPTTRFVLVTKGDDAVQRGKLERSGLAPLFDAVYIVAEKKAQTYCEIASELGLDPRATWMVGNSPRSDINPAVEAGLGAIFVPHDHTWTAEHETIDHPELVITLERFSDLLPLFGIEVVPD